MQEDIDYVIAHKTRASSGEGLEGIVSGVFVGTHKFFFFIPAQHDTQEGSNRRKVHVTENMFFGGKSISDFMDQKAKESGLSVKDFEDFMVKEMDKEMPTIRIIDLQNDIAQFKATANFFVGNLMFNKTDRRVGWDLFLYSLGKDKKKVRKFYINHDKLANK